jgi:murein DD-endopeptidase MepM/ murein hydrolase activator NlpD
MCLKRVRSMTIYGTVTLVLSLICLANLCFSPIIYAQGQKRSAEYALQHRLQFMRIKPFMHRPYYGTKYMIQRSTSYFDHDKPWYDTNGIFVRFDGVRKGNSTLMGCNPRVSCYDGHNGYDLDFYNETVLSAAAGKVIRAGWYNNQNHRSSFGLWVAIDHGNGYSTAYGHLSAISVKTGQHVGIQQKIGTSGSTGASTGPHLHFGTYYYPTWKATDPFGWYGPGANPNKVPDRYLWVSRPGI